MRVRGYADGTPCWAAVATSNVEASRAFYSALFGWEFVDGRFALEGRAVAGVRDRGHGPAAWLMSVSTDNAGASAHPWADPEPSAHRVALDVINASGHEGVAAAARKTLAKGRFTEGSVRTAESLSATSSIAYGAGAQSAAELLGDELGLRVTASDAVALDTVLLTVGTDFRSSEYVGKLGFTSDATTTSEAPSPTAVPATAAGGQAPTPANLTVMTAGSVPCVR